MEFEELSQKYNGDLDILNLIYHLEKLRPYTIEEIVEVIEQIKNVCIILGISLRDIVNILIAKELL